MNRQEATNKGLIVAVVAALAVGAGWLGGTSANAEGKPSYGCGPGFDYHVTTTQAAAEGCLITRDPFRKRASL